MKQNPTAHKVNERVRTALAQLLFTEIADPRLTLITVVAVEVTRDRSIADVYIATDPGRYDEVTDGLESAKGRLRSLLGQELEWRLTPELRFHIDTTLDHAIAIAEALKNVPHTLLSKGAYAVDDEDAATADDVAEDVAEDAEDDEDAAEDAEDDKDAAEDATSVVATADDKDAATERDVNKDEA